MALSVCLSPAAARAQDTGVIRGIALDSTTMRPLAEAAVTVAGGDGQLLADSLGEFRFEGVPPGRYSLVVDHPRLDSLGLTPILRVVEVAPGQDQTVVFSTPSPATLRGVYCDASIPVREGKDGILIGAVHDANTQVGQPNAGVIAEWMDDSGELGASAQETDRAGVFALCDLPTDRDIRITILLFGETETEEVVRFRDGRVLLEDLEVELSRPARVLGEVMDRDLGEPIANAVVTLEGTDFRAVTGAQGRFSFRDVPPGNYLLVLEHLAYGEQSQVLSVSGGVVDVTAEFSQQAIELEGITVTMGSSRLDRLGYFDRRQMREGFATFMEREDLVERSPLTLADALTTTPGVQVRREIEGSYLISSRGGVGIDNASCRLRLILDGMPLPPGPGSSLDNFLTQQVLAVEVYPSDLSVPARFQAIGAGTNCGAVVIWTGI